MNKALKLTPSGFFCIFPSLNASLTPVEKKDKIKGCNGVIFPINIRYNAISLLEHRFKN